ncbi:hypothetical protein [Geobacter sp. SVR]|uniref:hypothetical protein n=1 Tax=Geobacter sp. SVR TaxID=2495594 RepID=UPI00143EFBC5|nr:hypothetical protein [Geobacter sp. SVR]BCS55950.1 hypothetical protein GSVR_42580 [Geobacter sp. SVR]GCF84713.1 hypothetical protein GSbR_13130 [Geobacter sp. SVR]
MRDSGTYRRSYFIKALILTTIIVSILGYVDFITGEISIDILYIFCLCAVTWYTNRLIGMICILEFILAKTTADYYDQVKIGSHLYEWNTFNYVVMYVVICLCVGKLKKSLYR